MQLLVQSLDCYRIAELASRPRVTNHEVKVTADANDRVTDAILRGTLPGTNERPETRGLSVEVTRAPRWRTASARVRRPRGAFPRQINLTVPKSFAAPATPSDVVFQASTTESHGLGPLRRRLQRRFHWRFEPFGRRVVRGGQ